MIVETIDRYGLLRRVAQLLAQRHPEMQNVVEMHTAVTTWFFTPMRG